MFTSTETKKPTKIVVSISGKMHSGKDTAAEMLKEIFERHFGKSVQSLAIAQRLKEIAAAATGTTVEEQFSEAGKAKIPKYFGGASCGQIQQDIGSEFRKKYGADFFVNVTKDAIHASPADVVIVRDVRMPNEWDTVLSFERNIRFRMHGDPTGARKVSTRSQTHETEIALDDEIKYPPHSIILNEVVDKGALRETLLLQTTRLMRELFGVHPIP